MSTTTHIVSSPTQRRQHGKSLRASTPRRQLAHYDDVGRLDPLDLLADQAVSRVPELVPLRYSRMLESPFAFFRGAAIIMAADLARHPSVDLEVQLCGDAHLSNFGIYGTPERRLVFDINDFDETTRGPFEWDVKRLAASLSIAGENQNFPASDRDAAVRAAVRSYREAMHHLATLGNLDVWYSSLDVEQLVADPSLHDASRRLLERQIAKARTKDNRHAYSRLVEHTAQGPRIKAALPLITPIEKLTGTQTPDIRKKLTELVERYSLTLSPDNQELLRSYRPIHMAHKVVGVGSVGTRCWIILLLGADAHDPLLLQVKQAQESVVARFTSPSPYLNQGERVVAGQTLMQAASDLFLGWDRVPEGIDGQPRDFYVRQLRDWKGSVNIASLTPSTMRRYAALCGQALARAHARTGDRIALAAYLGTGDAFDASMAAFAAAYTRQNARDYATLAAAVADGRVIAAIGESS